MSLYAIGDLHLHFQAELKARGQLTERVWRDHESNSAGTAPVWCGPGTRSCSWATTAGAGT